jgi:NADH-quinone oxidoreductase subunit F
MIERKVLLRLHQVPDIHKLEIYRSYGGYGALAKASRMSPEEILGEVSRSGLRGRGGAGYPTGLKWKGVADQERVPHYFVCNLAEGEPGSFKDRELVKNPHQILEATAISAFAIKAERAFLYLRGIFVREEELLLQALREASEAGLIRSGGMLPVQMVIHRGEDSYIAGEETALLESLEGKPAIPRTKPPRPHEYGLFDCPTAVNNPETICNIIQIILQGFGAFRATGTTLSPGTKLFCLSGQIQKPGLYELPLGTKLSDLLYGCGNGPLPGRKLVAVFPGGPSTPLVPVSMDPTLDFEGLQKVGSALGTGGVIVIDDSTDIRKMAVEVADFFARESCGACPPCTIGTSETHALFQNLLKNPENSAKILLKIREFCEMMKCRGSCAHNRAAALTFLSLLTHFPDIFHTGITTERTSPKERNHGSGRLVQ